MDLGCAKIPRIAINALHNAIDPVYGLVWTDGQTIFIIPYDPISGTFDFASTTRHGKFQCVREVHWFRNSVEGKCFLCIVLDCVVTVWLCEGKLTDVCLEQVHRMDIRTVAQGCLQNPKVDVLCLLTATQCIFYSTHPRTTVTPFTLPLDSRMSVTCGCWSKDGSLLLIGVGASLLVYNWFDIGESLHNFRVMNCKIPGLAGVGRLSAVECLSEVEFLIATQLPLDQLCIQYSKEMFMLPDSMNQVEESALSNEPDDSMDVVVCPKSKEHSSSCLDKLLHLPRTNQACVGSSQLLLIEVDPVAQQAKKLSSINIIGLLSPDILHVCKKSVFIIAGSNTSNVLSLFKVSDGHLKLSGIMSVAPVHFQKMAPDERLKGLCSLSSKSCDQAGEAVLMMTGRISATDQIFPPTSSSAEYQLRLRHITDLRQQFESQNVGAADPVMRMSCKSVSDDKEDEMAILSSTSHCNRNDLSNSESVSNTDSLCQPVHHIRETKVTADNNLSTSSEGDGNSEDLAKLFSLNLQPLDYNLQKKPLVEVIGDSDKRVSGGDILPKREEKDEGLETEFLDFKAVLPHFITNLHPPTTSFSDSVNWSGSCHLDTEISSKLDLPSLLHGSVQNKKSTGCNTKCQDTASLSHLSHSEINMCVSGGSTATGCSNCATRHSNGATRHSNCATKCSNCGTRSRNCLDDQMSDVLMQLRLINLKLQIQNEWLVKLQSSVETMQQVSHVSKYQPASKPDVIRVILKQTLGTDVQKCFILDNHRLHLNSIKDAFNLVSVELLVDGDPCVLHADIDGFIPLSFSSNESICITGEPRSKEQSLFDLSADITPISKE